MDNLTLIIIALINGMALVGVALVGLWSAIRSGKNSTAIAAVATDMTAVKSTVEEVKTHTDGIMGKIEQLAGDKGLAEGKALGREEVHQETREAAEKDK